MKKFLALVMAAVLLCSTFSFTFAETVTSCDNGHLYEQKNADGTDKITVKTPADCENDGIGTKYCSRCKKDIEVTIPALGHVGADADRLSHTNATCTEGSTAVYAKCSREGCKATNFTLPYEPAKDHEWDLDETDPKNYKVVEPTCTEDGYTIYYCTREECPGDGVNKPAQKKVVDVDSKLGHDWRIASETIDPTCYADGVSGQYVYCDRCKLYSTDPDLEVKDEDGNVIDYSVDAHYVPALSHDVTTEFGADFDDLFFIDDADGFVDVTDDVKGLENGVTVFDPEEVSYGWPLDHAGKVTVTYTAETCTTDGSITVECSCGNYKRTETLKKWGHDYNMMVVSYVDNEGNTRRIEMPLSSVMEKWADLFGEKFDKAADFIGVNISTEKLQQLIFALDYTVFGEHFMADCTIKPIVQYRCAKCKDRVDAQGYACTEHTFGEDWEDWQLFEFTKLMPTVMEIRQLQVPEYKADQGKVPYERGDQVEVVAKNFEVFEKIAWCTDMKVTVRCAHCAVTKVFNVKGKGHDLPETGDGVEIRESTCKAAGLEILVCRDDNCGYSVAQSIPMAPHTIDDDKTVIVAPTCTEDGTRTFYCKVCSTDWSEKIPSYGHDYNWITTKPAECKVEGEKELTCARCGDVKETAVIPEAHIFADFDDITGKTNVTLEAIKAAAVPQYGTEVVDRIRHTECETEEHTHNSNPYDKNCCYGWYGVLKCGKTEHTHSDAEGCYTYTNVYNLIGYMLPEVPWTDCSLAGNLQYTCINCKNVTVTKAAGEHEWYTTTEEPVVPAWTYVDDETCRYTFKQHYACKNCVQPKEETVTVDDVHVWTGNLKELYIPTETAPTCQKDGLGYYKCADCGKYFLDTVKAFNHSFETIYDDEKGCWTYECEWCGEIEDAIYDAEKYVFDTSKIVWGNKTTGTGYVELEETLNPTFILGARYAYIQWTWVTKAGDNVVADTVVELKSLGEGKYSFNAKGVSVAGATLDNVVIYITDDADADDFSSTNYGATRMD